MKNKKKSARCRADEANQAVAAAVAAWNRVDALKFELERTEEKAKRYQIRADELTLKASEAKKAEEQV